MPEDLLVYLMVQGANLVRRTNAKSKFVARQFRFLFLVSSDLVDQVLIV